MNYSGLSVKTKYFYLNINVILNISCFFSWVFTNYLSLARLKYLIESLRFFS